MRKIYTCIAMATMAVTMLTSCDVEFWEDMGDRYEAHTLDGTWSGYIDTYYYDRWELTGDSYRTTMYFGRENAYGGWGYEVDYDLNSPYRDYYYCEFRWEVTGGTIRIRYADSWNDVYISDYSLSHNNFSGYMDDGTTKDIVFKLTYDNGFDWSYWCTRGLTRSGADTSADAATGRVKASGKFVSRATPSSTVEGH